MNKWERYHRKVAKQIGGYAVMHFKKLLRARTPESKKHHELCAMAWSRLAFNHAKQAALAASPVCAAEKKALEEKI